MRFLVSHTMLNYAVKQFDRKSEQTIDMFASSMMPAAYRKTKF